MYHTVFPLTVLALSAVLSFNSSAKDVWVSPTGNDADDGEVYLYRYTEKDGQPELDNIESDEEFEIVSEAFDEVLDAAEYDELAGEDEE